MEKPHIAQFDQVSGTSNKKTGNSSIYVEFRPIGVVVKLKKKI